jgi:glycosyltransferase involved in cell wall biosynthesis
VKILFDTQIFDWQINGGISRYFVELIQRLDKGQDADVLFKCRHSYNTYIQNSKWLVNKPMFKNINFKGKLRLLKTLNQRLNWEYPIKNLKRGSFDIFHPTYYETYFFKHIEKKPFVLTVYDLTHEKFFGKTPSVQQLLERKKKLINAATHIVAISENTKKDVVEEYGIDPSKVTTIYLASSFDPGNKSSATAKDIPGEYILFVGSRSGYKNFNGFINEAAPVLKQKNVKLVIAGGGDLSAAEQSLFNKLGIADHIIAFSHVSDDHLKRLYEKALVFIFPSLYEGFGIPVLEAMQCNCPVLLSNNSSLPEVGGDAAAYFDPASEGDLQTILSKLIEDKDGREKMKTDGMLQAAKFSWDNTAKEHIKLYQSLL